MKKALLLMTLLFSIVMSSNADTSYSELEPRTAVFDLAALYTDASFYSKYTDSENNIKMPCSLTNDCVTIQFDGKEKAWKSTTTGFFALHNNDPKFTISVEEGFISEVYLTLGDGLDFKVIDSEEAVAHWIGKEKNIIFVDNGHNGYLKSIKITYVPAGAEEVKKVGLVFTNEGEVFNWKNDILSLEFDNEGIKTKFGITKFEAEDDVNNFNITTDLKIRLEPAEEVEFHGMPDTPSDNWPDYIFSEESTKVEIIGNDDKNYGLKLFAGCSGLYKVSFESANQDYELAEEYSFNVNIYPSHRGMKLIDGEYKFDVDWSQYSEEYIYEFLNAQGELIESRLMPTIDLPIFGAEVWYKIHIENSATDDSDSRRVRNYLTDQSYNDMGFVLAKNNVIDLTEIANSESTFSRISFVLTKNGSETPMDSKGEGQSVQMINFSKSNVATGVETLTADDDKKIRYYNLQGVEVRNPGNGIYIRVKGDKAEKVLL